MPAPAPVIVKLGGSLWNNRNLKRWVTAICDAGAPIALVPGGGPFADAVRVAQAVMHFTDAAAHKMALLAMAQYAQALGDLDERLAIAERPDDFAEVWLRRRTAVWSPVAMAAEREDIPQNWEMTSDSLAAWLARELGAVRIVLVKSAAPDAHVTAAGMASQGVVDSVFLQFLMASGADAIWLGPDDWPSLHAALKGEAGVTVTL
jgi:aspartokinase-like uncharacterized kinase